MACAKRQQGDNDQGPKPIMTLRSTHMTHPAHWIAEEFRGFTSIPTLASGPNSAGFEFQQRYFADDRPLRLLMVPDNKTLPWILWVLAGLSVILGILLFFFG